MSATTAHEIARFLSAHPPFDALSSADLDRVAAATEEEFHRAGETIFSQGAGPVEHLRVVRTGAVEIVFDRRVLDLLGPGELFGHASMLSGLPTGFEARAAEDTACYRIPAEVAQGSLSGPAGLRFVARSLLELWEERTAAVTTGFGIDPSLQPAGALLRGKPVVCGPDTPIRDAAAAMTSAGATAAVVELGDGALGILTDRDLRTRVLARGLTGDTPVSAAMSAPAYTCVPDRLGGDVLLDMLDRGFRHLPVVSPAGKILGILEDTDIVAAQTRSSFYLRRRIARAGSVQELADAARELRPSVIAMHEARVAAINISAVYSVVVDALTRRLLELALADATALAETTALADSGALPETTTEFAWLALGSQARREALPGSDIDSAIVWFDSPGEADPRPRLH
ncbi:MAG: CBS domain-containing protein, partial [Solirubrobacterales bacterium]|nr:CBS domain-containing protein [Solirubrobacterales bacterium]